MLPDPEERPLQHPAARAALSSRNAVAAEMSIAGRAGLDPADPCWEQAACALAEPGSSRWVLASDDYRRMRDDLAVVTAVGEETFPTGAAWTAGHREIPGPDVPFEAGRHSASLAALAVPLPGVGETGARLRAALEALRSPLSRMPAARSRRERLETAFWFVVGGTGGLVLAVLVRTLEMWLSWR